MGREFEVIITPDPNRELTQQRLLHPLTNLILKIIDEMLESGIGHRRWYNDRPRSSPYSTPESGG
jgi:hypothetical protein